jgi:GTPase SAR1 family protein
VASIVGETTPAIIAPLHADVSIWDFGGQEEFYSTHSVFLGARAVYLMVVDLSKPFHQKEEGKS